jgi:uncharacterized protein (DUF4415 family)
MALVKKKLSQIPRPGAEALRALRSMPDESIDYSEIPELSDEWFRKARKAAEAVPAQPKQPVALRLDADVLDWFRRQGPGYQSRINAILRAYKAAATAAEVDDNC